MIKPITFFKWWIRGVQDRKEFIRKHGKPLPMPTYTPPKIEVKK